MYIINLSICTFGASVSWTFESVVKTMLVRIQRYWAFVRQWLADSREYYRSNAASNNRRNWKIICPMALLYLAYLCFYLFAICPAMKLDTQTAALRLSTLVHAVFTLNIFLARKETPPSWTVDFSISLFAAEILGLSGFLEIVVFSGEAPFLFPMCLVLMTQIYTRPPFYRFLEIVLPSAAYLICCRLTRPTNLFIMDVAAISIALAISFVAAITITIYMLRTFRTQQALEKMCALDPMTGVNNKSTFQFRVESYLHSRPKGGFALAISDLDGFKSINDRHGHRVGDEVLKNFSRQLHRLVDSDPGIIAGRFGGDEFVLFFKCYRDEQSVLEKTAELCTVPGFDFPVTCSIGVAFSPSGDAEFRRLFDCADQSLYRSKSLNPGGISTSDADAAGGEDPDAVPERTL
jgi:diguanylate cyclase (GGDEF)-like protein